MKGEKVYTLLSCQLPMVKVLTELLALSNVRAYEQYQMQERGPPARQSPIPTVRLDVGR